VSEVGGGDEPIRARSLFKRYGELVAVDHVDLTVERGDVFGYLGPNGAGKTTSLRMLLGLIRPTSGEARLFGRDPLADEGLTILLSSHLLNEVEELCNRVAIVRKGSVVYEGTLAELKATATAGYRLRTTHLDAARQIASNTPGLADLRAEGAELWFTGSDASVAALTVALGSAGVGFTALVPERASLESLFLELTEAA
jgi:ABC-type multidrug transport system ATPase subunit